VTALLDDDIDALLLSHAKTAWQKVAMIIGKAMGDSKSLDSERASERIAALVAAGKRESAGDISKWRFSEVRLPNNQA
jgi:hypothetical protein